MAPHLARDSPINAYYYPHLTNKKSEVEGD